MMLYLKISFYIFLPILLKHHFIIYFQLYESASYQMNFQIFVFTVKNQENPACSKWNLKTLNKMKK